MPSPPRGWAFCHGQLLPLNQNQALFALLGTRYGGNGVTTFALPDLRGRVPVHYSNRPGSAPRLPIGTAGGAETVALTTAQMPAHTHALEATSATATARPPVPARLFATDTSGEVDFYAPAGGPAIPLAPEALSFSGAGQAHENMQPFLVLNYIIALTGIFPSRQ